MKKIGLIAAICLTAAVFVNSSQVMAQDTIKKAPYRIKKVTPVKKDTTQIKKEIYRIKKDTSQMKRDTSGIKRDTTQMMMKDTTTAMAYDLFGVISANPDYSTLVKVMNVAGTKPSLMEAGPYTFFAPINQGFVKLTQAKLDSLAKDTTKLNSVLKYHIVKGKYTKADILKALAGGKKSITLPTIEGGTLTLSVNAQKNLEIADGKGHKALVTSFDKMATNGVIHGIDNVLLPNK